MFKPNEMPITSPNISSKYIDLYNAIRNGDIIKEIQLDAKYQRIKGVKKLSNVKVLYYSISACRRLDIEHDVIDIELNKGLSAIFINHIESYKLY